MKKYTDQLMDDCFQWVTIDVNPLLPNSWKETLLNAVSNASFIELNTKSVTSRESDTPGAKPRFLFLNGDALQHHANWLIKLYKESFLMLAKKYYGDDTIASASIRRGIVMNALTNSSMRYESHIDSNPITGLLFVNSVDSGFGGELVISTNKNACNIEQIEENPIAIRPVSGMLLLFSGQKWPHYVRPLKKEGILRSAIVMNYYNSSCQEYDRPHDLDHHLGLIGEPS